MRELTAREKLKIENLHKISARISSLGKKVLGEDEKDVFDTLSCLEKLELLLSSAEEWEEEKVTGNIYQLIHRKAVVTLDICICMFFNSLSKNYLTQTGFLDDKFYNKAQDKINAIICKIMGKVDSSLIIAIEKRLRSYRKRLMNHQPFI